MCETYNNKKLKLYIEDVRYFDIIVDAFKGIDFVLTNSVLKQVSSCEFYQWKPLELMLWKVACNRNLR